MLKSIENHILDSGPSVGWKKISFDWSLADQISQQQRIFSSNWWIVKNLQKGMVQSPVS